MSGFAHRRERFRSAAQLEGHQAGRSVGGDVLDLDAVEAELGAEGAQDVAFEHAAGEDDPRELPPALPRHLDGISQHQAEHPVHGTIGKQGQRQTPRARSPPLARASLCVPP